MKLQPIQIEYTHEEFTEWQEAADAYVNYRRRVGKEAQLWYSDINRRWIVACFHPTHIVTLAELRSSAVPNPGAAGSVRASLEAPLEDAVAGGSGRTMG